MVVDDDSLVLMNTAAMLEDLGHEVIEATSGEQALRVLRRGKRIGPGAELNHRHADFQSAALPTELPGLASWGADAAAKGERLYIGSPCPVYSSSLRSASPASPSLSVSVPGSHSGP